MDEDEKHKLLKQGLLGTASKAFIAEVGGEAIANSLNKKNIDEDHHVDSGRVAAVETSEREAGAKIATACSNSSSTSSNSIGNGNGNG